MITTVTTDKAKKRVNAEIEAGLGPDFFSFFFIYLFISIFIYMYFIYIYNILFL